MGLYASTSTAVSATTWATIPQPIFNSHQSIDSFIPQIEFVTSGCTSKNLATCTSLSSCAQCLARADCKFKKDMGYCIGQDSARYSSYEDVTECPAPCSSFKKCYECRDDADTTCHWVQSTTHATNNSCQSPEAMADALETCNTIASIYTTGRIGYAFLLIGCTLQLLGVCSWCGVKKDARSNCPLLCTGCNIHWIAGLVLMIWGAFWMLGNPVFLFYFSFVAHFFLPCMLGVPAGIVALVNICPAAKAGGKLPEGYGTEAQVEQPKNAL